MSSAPPSPAVGAPCAADIEELRRLLRMAAEQHARGARATAAGVAAYQRILDHGQADPDPKQTAEALELLRDYVNPSLGVDVTSWLRDFEDPDTQNQSRPGLLDKFCDPDLMNKSGRHR